MIRTHVFSWLGLPAAGLLLGVSGWSYFTAHHARDLGDPAVARREGRPIPVRAEAATSSTVEDVIGATAVTVPSQTAWIEVGPSRQLRPGSPIAALIVKAVHVREGDFVHKGQLVCEFEDRAYNDLVAQQKAVLETATAALDRVKEQLKYNAAVRELNLSSASSAMSYRIEDENNRDKECEIFTKLNQKGAASLIAYYDARSKLFEARYYRTQAKLDLERAQKVVKVGVLTDKQELAKAISDFKTAEVELELAQQDAERLKVHSPIDGFLTFENSVVTPENGIATYGNSLSAGTNPGTATGTVPRPVIEPVPGQFLASDSTIGQVLRLDPMDLLVDYPLERLDDLRIGQKAEVVLDSFPKDTFTGEVLRIGPKVNAQLRVMPVFVRIDNSKARIKPGITGFVRMRNRKEAVTIPSTAVLQQNGKAMVFCVQDGRARLHEVRTGATIGNDVVEITNGLAAGHEVVIFQNFYRHLDQLSQSDCYLKDNDPVDVHWEKWAGRQ
jgi:multidrug efflux pump subunit AcrA (membrane-fusion protein)